MIVSLVEEDTEKMNKQRINNHVYSYSLFVSFRLAIMLNFNISKVAYSGLGYLWFQKTVFVRGEIKLST